MTEQQSPVWFVNGCSTGSGRELGKLVLARGWRAVVTARNPDQVRDLVQEREESAITQQLDMPDRAKIADAVQRAQEKWTHRCAREQRRIRVSRRDRGGEDKQARTAEAGADSPSFRIRGETFRAERR